MKKYLFFSTRLLCKNLFSVANARTERHLRKQSCNDWNNRYNTWNCNIKIYIYFMIFSFMLGMQAYGQAFEDDIYYNSSDTMARFSQENFSNAQRSEKENKRLINSYLSQAKLHEKNSNRHIRIVGNPYGLIINPSYTDRVKIELPEYIKETQQAVICLNNTLLIDPNNQAAKKMSIEFNMKVALQMFKMGEDSYETKRDVYFNRALEYFANAYESGLDSIAVFNYVHQINSREHVKNWNNFFYYVSIPDENLHKVSTMSQLKTSQQIDSLNKVIAANKNTADKQTLFNLYAQLLESAKYYYTEGKFQYRTYNEAFENKVNLAIELERTDSVDYLDVYSEYRRSSYDYVAQQREKHEIKKKIEKKIELRKNQPNYYTLAEPEMVFVQGGTFWMGCTNEQCCDCDKDESPTHRVTLDDFYIGKYEVTQVQWDLIMDSDIEQLHQEAVWQEPRTKFCGKGDNYPMYYVTWADAQEFITRLNAATGRQYRLPTEAEWEYAARGGNKSKGYKYSGSNNIYDVAWFEDNSDYSVHPVGSKLPNELGIYDMSGNVREWCWDWYDRYPTRSQQNPVIKAKPANDLRSFDYHIVRGGSWDCTPSRCRIAFRSTGDIFSIWCREIGFRLVLIPQ